MLPLLPLLVCAPYGEVHSPGHLSCRLPSEVLTPHPGDTDSALKSRGELLHTGVLASFGQSPGGRELPPARLVANLKS